MIHVTFPGRAGDLLWALPTVRAIATEHGPVWLEIAGEFASMLPLLQQQPYLAEVTADPSWSLTPPNEWLPPSAGQAGDMHLGYRGWPDQPLAQFIYAQTQREYPERTMAPLDLETPWLLVDPYVTAWPVAVGFTEAWFELKYGLCKLLELSPQMTGAGPAVVLPAPGSRWVTEGDMDGINWLETAERIMAAKVFLGDCSALHVLACALGKPVVLCEPMEARHNDIFYPYGKTGRVKLVTGNDGKPTFDARHVADVLSEVLDAR